MTGEGEAREYWYSGTETGDDQLGGRSCTEKRQALVEGVLGQEGDAPPGRTSDRVKRGRGWSRIAMLQ